MAKKERGLLKQYRKKLGIETNVLDTFIGAQATSTKYYIEDSYETNKMFRYLLLLKMKGASLDEFFKEYIELKDLKNE